MLWRPRDEKPVMDLRRLRCLGACACGGALVVLMVPPLRFILASQAGLVIGWRTAAMPSNILTMAVPSCLHFAQRPAGLEASAPSRPCSLALELQLAAR